MSFFNNMFRKVVKVGENLRSALKVGARAYTNLSMLPAQMLVNPRKAIENTLGDITDVGHSGAKLGKSVDSVGHLAMGKAYELTPVSFVTSVGSDALDEVGDLAGYGNREMKGKHVSRGEWEALGRRSLRTGVEAAIGLATEGIASGASKKVVAEMGSGMGKNLVQFASKEGVRIRVGSEMTRKLDDVMPKIVPR